MKIEILQKKSLALILYKMQQVKFEFEKNFKECQQREMRCDFPWTVFGVLDDSTHMFTLLDSKNVILKKSC